MPTWVSWILDNPSVLIAIIGIIAALLPAGSPLRNLLEKLKLLVPVEDKLAAKLSKHLPQAAVVEYGTIDDLLYEALELHSDGKADEAKQVMDVAVRIKARQESDS